ncbi:hypothetical protein BaRGS_00027623, partial [Batillaria attramentaria]
NPSPLAHCPGERLSLAGTPGAGGRVAQHWRLTRLPPFKHLAPVFCLRGAVVSHLPNRKFKQVQIGPASFVSASLAISDHRFRLVGFGITVQKGGSGGVGADADQAYNSEGKFQTVIQDISPALNSPNPQDMSPALNSPTPQDISPALNSPTPQDISPALNSPTPQDISPALNSPNPQDIQQRFRHLQPYPRR